MFDYDNLHPEVSFDELGNGGELGEFVAPTVIREDANTRVLRYSPRSFEVVASNGYHIADAGSRTEALAIADYATASRNDHPRISA